MILRRYTSNVVEKFKLGIPKGSLHDATIALFRRAGWKIDINGRSYFPDINDDTIGCAICRAQEMSRYVESGTLDAGLTGKDWISENESDVRVVEDLVYSKVSQRPARWVLAVPYNSDIQRLEDLAGKKIATELVNFTIKYFDELNIDVNVEFSWGATEAKVVSGLADAIVEVTETGSTIKAHGLRIIHELLQTNTQLIANHAAWADAEKMVGLKMNLPKARLKKAVALLPSLNAPTVSPLYQSDWFAVETVVASSVVRDLIPELLKNGAEGIIEYPLNKVI